MNTYTIDIPIHRPPMTANDQRRAHWTAVRKAKTEVEWLVTAAAKAAKLPAIDPCVITVTWFAPDGRVRDSDSLGPFCKAALDALVRCRVLLGDDHRHVLSTRMAVAVDRRNPRIQIAILKAIKGLPHADPPDPLELPSGDHCEPRNEA